MDRQLMDYLPGIMQEMDEFKQLMNCEQRTVEALWQATEDLLKEGFLDTQTKIGASRWESILEIIPKDTESIEVRSFRIQGKLQESLPYTYRVLERLLRTLCGDSVFKMELNNDCYTLSIRLSLERKKLIGEAERLAERIVPANLILDIDLSYNTYGMLENTTYGNLIRYGHCRLREEPLERKEKNG